MTGSSKTNYQLVLITNGASAKEFALEEGSNLLGRWDPDEGSFPEIDLEPDDVEAKISRKHAVITKTGSKLTIEDVGSLNGTFLNRTERLEAGAVRDLKVGDEIMLGGLFFKIEQVD